MADLPSLRHAPRNNPPQNHPLPRFIGILTPRWSQARHTNPALPIADTREPVSLLLGGEISPKPSRIEPMNPGAPSCSKTRQPVLPLLGEGRVRAGFPLLSTNFRFMGRLPRLLIAPCAHEPQRNIFSRRGNRFSLSSEERVGVRTGFPFLSANFRFMVRAGCFLTIFRFRGRAAFFIQTSSLVSEPSRAGSMGLV